MIDPGLLLNMMKRNLERSMNPVGIERGLINTWWKETNVNRDGEWFFFTGLLYQLVPYVDGILKFLEKIERIRFGQKIALSPAFMTLSSYLIKNSFSRNLKKETDGILSNIYRYLSNSDVDVFYNPEFDQYSGIMLHDIGDNRGFELYVKEVTKSLEENSIDKIITADPHTTYAVKELYPSVTGKKFKVKSYIELISVDNPEVVETAETGIHDPCYYGRYTQLGGKIAEIVEKAGINCFIPDNSGKMTSCCGGAAEYVSPLISKEIARLRVEEFGEKAIITACPICLVALRRGGGNVTDLAAFLR